MIIPFFAQDLREVSPSVLAYIGDSVYELYSRCHVSGKNSSGSHNMHKQTIKYVCAQAQSAAIKAIEPTLTDSEKNFFKRGRNSHPNTVSKNASPADYMNATGFETLIGYLYLDNQIERLEEIIYEVFAYIDSGSIPDYFDGEEKN